MERGVYAASTWPAQKSTGPASKVWTLKRPEGRAPGAVSRCAQAGLKSDRTPNAKSCAEASWFTHRAERLECARFTAAFARTEGGEKFYGYERQQNTHDKVHLRW